MPPTTLLHQIQQSEKPSPIDTTVILQEIPNLIVEDEWDTEALASTEELLKVKK